MTWYPKQAKLVVSGGPIAAGAAGSSVVGGGWIDELGGVYSVDSANLIQFGNAAGTPWFTSQLLRPTSENPSDYNSRVVAKFKYYSDTTIYLASRLSAAHDKVLCFGLQGGAGAAYYIDTNFGSLPGPGPYAQPADGTVVVGQLDTVQTDANTTTLTYTLFAADGTTVLTTQTATCTSAGIQNVTGQNGIFVGQGSHLNVSELQTFTDIATAATAVTIVGPNPSSGTTGNASGNFTVGTNNPITSGTVVVTPVATGGGSFSPATVTLSAGTPTATFTYTPTSAGSKTVSVTNNASLTNPSAITYSASGPSAAANITFIAPNPATGNVGQPSGTFYVGTDGYISTPVVVTPHDGGDGGTFTPPSVTLAAGSSPIGSFTYTPANAGTKSITITNNGGLGNQGPFSFGVTGAPTATSYTASANPTTVSVGSTSALSFALVGGPTSAAGSITLSDGGAGGTFSVNPIAVASGATTIGSSIYSPPAGVATRTITFSHTGLGFSGDPASIALTVQTGPVVILANQVANVARSPFNWTDGAVAGSLQCWQPGAYLRFRVGNANGGNLTLNLGAGCGIGYYNYRWDNGAMSALQGTSYNGGGSVTIAAPNDGLTHDLWVFHYAINQVSGRWVRSLFFNVESLTLAAGMTAATANRKSKFALIQGDSITEGILANNGIDGHQYDYSWYLGQALYNAGFEYGINACGGGGYTSTGSGDVPPSPTWFSRADTSHQYLNGTTWQAISTGGPVDVPDIYMENWGANDGNNPNCATAFNTVMTALRAAAPNCLLLKLRAFGGYSFSSVSTGITNYLAGQPGGVDPKFKEVNLDIAARESQYGGLHPGIVGHANIAAITIERVLDLYNASQGGSTGVYPAITSVLSTAPAYGPTSNLQGTYLSAPVASVLSTQQYGAGGTGLTGTYAVAPVGKVRSGFQYGAGGTGLTGTDVSPDPSTVVAGTGYGAGGTEFNGSYSGGGVPPASALAAYGYPTVAFDDATYSFFLLLNGPASAAGSVVLPATAGVAWNGGAAGAAGAAAFALNAQLAVVTVKFAAGSHASIALTHTGLGFTGSNPTLAANTTTASSGGGATPATSYIALGFDAVPVEGETYTVVLVFNGPVSAPGSVVLPAKTGIAWNGGAAGAASTAAVSSGATYATFTMGFIEGSYTTTALTHTGLGFTGSDPTLPTAVATAPGTSGGGIDPNALIPANPVDGSYGQAFLAMLMAGFGNEKIVGRVLTKASPIDGSVQATFQVLLDSNGNITGRIAQ